MRTLFFLLIPFFVLFASETLPFDLTYPTVNKSSKIKQESYNRMEVFIKGQGYISKYGHTWEQKLEYPEISGDYKEIVTSFIAKALNIPRDAISRDNYAKTISHGKTYWIKLSISDDKYSFVLLREEPHPNLVTLDENKSYAVTPKFFKRFSEINIPHNIAIPHVTAYAIERVKYKNYDELTFYYQRGSTLHKGQYWNIDFAKTDKNPNSGRYSIAHDYKTKLLNVGATILEDKDNTIHFKLNYKGADNIILFSGYNSSFSLKIIQEESFKQALILTPDAIKTELDKTGKITLDGIYFDFNKATLKPESQKAILSAVALMERYNDLVLSVHGHTDNKGSDTYNAKLSSERAASVMDAIVAQGIKPSRLSYKGHGEKDPIATNDTDEGRAQNRRVELHKESGGEKQSIITIDFIKPIQNSRVTKTRTYQNDKLGIQFTKPYSKEKKYQEFTGTHKTIAYEILKEGKVDTAFSRKAIIKNYENILELYNAKILGKYSDTLYFEIVDRGDGKKVYGRIEGYTGSYTIRFLIEE